MKPERKRALLIVSATFVIGVMIGSLVTVLILRNTTRQPAAWRQEGKEAFMKKIVEVAGADSVQARQMRPYMLETMARIDTLQKNADLQVNAVVDSFAVKLTTILTEDQLKRLHEWHQRGKDRRAQRWR